jgi:putative membrane-bound dehydrogenase-like protein
MKPAGAGPRSLLATLVAAALLHASGSTMRAASDSLPSLPLPADAPRTLPGWQLELVAQAPDLVHPSVVCTAPDGRVFVAEDPMDIRADVPADASRGRILCFHPDGRRTVFADRLQAVFGMQYLEGRLLVLHNPRFTAFNDGGDHQTGSTELVTQTNPKPWALDWNDHVPANFRLGMDGFLHVAVGDKGLFGTRGTDGSTVELHGGGIWRLKPDGTRLGIFARGVRNILDVAMDAEDELFTYDNTDEHDWMGRLTHMQEGGEYGYPHDFVPRRPYTLWMMHDFGGGAATGVECETAGVLPEEFRGNLFLADFGKRQVLRVVTERAGATHRVVRHQELFPSPPESFRPVGIAWTPDNRGLFVCDWAHRDTKENAAVGRLWKVTWTNAPAVARPAWHTDLAMGRSSPVRSLELLLGLENPDRAVRLVAQRELTRRIAAEDALLGPTPPGAVEIRSHSVRQETASFLLIGKTPHMRIHALWALVGAGGSDELTHRVVLEALRVEKDAAVRRQLARALGIMARREAAPALRQCVADAAETPAVRAAAATALGRLGEAAAVPELVAALEQEDPFARHAAFQALNALGRSAPATWTDLLSRIGTATPRAREGIEFALRQTWDARLAWALVEAFDKARDPEIAVTHARLLGGLLRTHPKWDGGWWAYHPALTAAPEPSVDWEGTAAIADALRRGLAHPERRVRWISADAFARTGFREAGPWIRERFTTEADVLTRPRLFEALVRLEDVAVESLTLRLLEGREPELLEAAMRTAASRAMTSAVPALIGLAGRPFPGRPLALTALGRLRSAEAVDVLSTAVAEPVPEVRLAAIEALGESRSPAALAVLSRTAEGTNDVDRTAAVRALGRLGLAEGIPVLLRQVANPSVRAAAIEALARTPDARALDAYLAALSDRNPSVRALGRSAVESLKGTVRGTLEQRAASLPALALEELRKVYAEDRAATNGPIFTTVAAGPSVADHEAFALANAGDAVRGQRLFWDPAGVACIRCHAVAGHGVAFGPDLTLAGAQFGRRELIEHVLHPSRSVREGYQQTLVVTRDDETLTGLVRSESASELVLVDALGRPRTLAKSDIVERTLRPESLMPEGLHAGLTPEQFADLIAYLESRKTDPRLRGSRPTPDGWTDLLAAHEAGVPAGWREFPAGTQRIDAATRSKSASPVHWGKLDGRLVHDGQGGDLWTDAEFGDFELELEWRWTAMPVFEDFPLINSEGLEAGPDGRAATLRVLDAGDSGVLFRGLYKAQANLFCYPVGSGEFWEYRTDPASTPAQRRAFTPSKAADRPIGDWNTMRLRVAGNRVTVEVNGETVIRDAEMHGLPAKGPIGLQHEHGPIEFRNVFVRERR